MLTSIFKKIVSLLPPGVARSIYSENNRRTRAKKIQNWKNNGAPVPPIHQYKQLVVEKAGKENNLETLVETGTFKGHMVEAQRKNFDKIYSIELDRLLCEAAVTKFKSFPHIKIVQGDSSVKLKSILDEIQSNGILFWLDGHYCGENTGLGDKQCPIYEELDTIFDHKIQHKYILIDDARCFNGTYDYPTIPALTAYIGRKDPVLQLKIENDIIHIYS